MIHVFVLTGAARERSGPTRRIRITPETSSSTAQLGPRRGSGTMADTIWSEPNG
jgi:hypothetical protein